MIAFLSIKSLSRDEILTWIRRDPTISEPVRKFALDLARHAVATTVSVPEHTR